MATPPLYAATFGAAYLYVISPGPAFLAMFTLTASRGRGAGARFVGGHLAGDTLWGALAVAAIVGASRLGSTLFDLLGLFCGAYLMLLGWRALRTRGEAKPAPVGAARPLATGLLFGLTNPKAYPVALAMFSAIVAPYARDLSLADAPKLFVAAFSGFLAADATLVFMAGLAPVRRFFLARGLAITRVVGLVFIAFGARSALDGGLGLWRGGARA
ncbi:MAG: LysE family transporter [Hyphomicrobiales bacterium]|nr:LysE family transporter [Hyphomicrobiales bacterium]MDE2016517.1 LysE family transporter [Hyphomicrobiales bacterium]